MLFGVFREVQQPLLLEVVPHEVCLVIEDELATECTRTRVGDTGSLRFGSTHLEDWTEHLIHGKERSRHAGAAGEELASPHTVPAAQVGGQVLDTRLDATLLRCLR